jgi:hypothetical protein
VVPVRELYAEIEEHVRALFEGVGLGTDGPDLRLGEASPNKGALEAIGSLLEFHLMHPAPWVMESAWRCLGHLLRTQSSGSKVVIEGLMAASEKVQERLIPVMETIGRSDAALIAPYRDGIVALAASPHGGLRCAARRIAWVVGWTFPERVPPAVTTLPSIYNLALPPIDREAREEMFVEGEGLVSRGSDEPPLAAHLAELEEMAEVTGVPAANLITRAGQIMLEHDPERGWTGEAEKRLQAWLEEIGPKFTYRRPRYLAGRRAVHHLLAELEDHGVAGADRVAYLCGMLRWYDPSLVLHIPAARPAAVPAMMEDRMSYGDRWLGEIDQAFSRLLERTGDGKMILAEETHLAHPVWENNQEERLAQFVAGNAGRPGEGEKFFARVMVGLVERYRSYGQCGVHSALVLRNAHPPLVLRNAPFRLEGSGGEWLAFNPWVGEELGWRIADDGWFRWVDPNGQTMVETIHWVDGPIDLSPFADAEVGEGCMVLVSPDAATRIVARFGQLARVMRVTRKYHEDRRDREKSAVRVSKLGAI